MRLTSVNIDGLKNLRDVDIQIPHLLALSGPNGSGKTAILQGIRIAVLGHDPETGRTLSATRELAGEERGIALGLSFDNGFGIHRVLGKSTETSVVPPEGETTERERQARIDEETGSFPFSFDLAAFLDLSAEKRRDFLFELLPRGAADLDQETFRDWLGYDAADEVVKRGIDHLWQEHVMAAQTAIDGLATAIDSARDRMLKAERDRQAAATISEDADRDAREASESVADFDEDELERLQAEVTIAEQRLGEIRQAEEDAEHQERRHAHQVRVAELRLDETRQELASLEGQLNGLPESSEEEITAAAEAMAAARAALNDAGSIPDEDLERIQELGAAAERAKGNRSKVPEQVAGIDAQLNVERRTANSIRNRIQALTDADTCPVCGTAADMDHVREELQAELAEVEARAGDLSKRAQALLEESRELDAAQEKAVAELEAAKATAERKAGEERRTRQAELDAASQRVNELRMASERRQSLTAQVETARARLERVEADVESLRQEAPEGPADRSEERLQLIDQATTLRQQVSDLQKTARAYGKAEALREQADRKRKDLELAEYRAAAFKRLHSGLQKLRARAIQSMVGPVESRAAEILEAIDPAKRFAFRFEREGKAVLDFGFEEDGVFRSYDAASTGEDAFLAVVLVAATVAAVQPVWPVLMIDNIEQVDDRRRSALQEALARPEIADLFGNVILAGCCSFDAGAWEVVRVDQLTTPTAAAA